MFQFTGPRLLRSVQPFGARTFLTTARLNSDSPVLSRLRNDLKTAMRSKDTPRLNVLRALLAEITNASKTDKPIESDIALYTLLRNQVKGAETAIKDFQAAKRDDLVQKEQGHIQVLQGYQEEIPKWTTEEVDRIVQETVDEIKSQDPAKFNRGTVMKSTLAKVAGKVHDSKYIADKVKTLTAAS